MNQGTSAMALENPLGECGHLPLEVDQEGVRPPSSDDLDGAVGIWAWWRVMATPERKEWEPISWAWNPRRWKPIFWAVSRRWRTMLDPVKDLSTAPGAT